MILIMTEIKWQAGGMSIGAPKLRMKASKAALGTCDMSGNCVALVSRTVFDDVSSIVIVPPGVVVVIRDVERVNCMPTQGQLRRTN